MCFTNLDINCQQSDIAKLSQKPSHCWAEVALISSNTPTPHPTPTRTGSKKMDYQPSGAWGPRSPLNQTSWA